LCSAGLLEIDETARDYGEKLKKIVAKQSFSRQNNLLAYCEVIEVFEFLRKFFSPADAIKGIVLPGFEVLLFE